MSDQPKEEKVMTFLDRAKENYNDITYLNSSSAQYAQVAALIFIGEQLERIANALVGVAWNSKASRSNKETYG